jgi:hypothetical protein
MDRKQAGNCLLRGNQQVYIERRVHEELVKYIKSYTSAKPLSPDWVERKEQFGIKGNNTFWQGLTNIDPDEPVTYGGNSADGSRTIDVIGIRYVEEPSQWNYYEVLAPTHFKDACRLRTFNPYGGEDFDADGKPSPNFCHFLEDLILRHLDDAIQ